MTNILHTCILVHWRKMSDWLLRDHVTWICSYGGRRRTALAGNFKSSSGHLDITLEIVIYCCYIFPISVSTTVSPVCKNIQQQKQRNKQQQTKQTKKQQLKREMNKFKVFLVLLALFFCVHFVNCKQRGFCCKCGATTASRYFKSGGQGRRCYQGKLVSAFSFTLSYFS